MMTAVEHLPETSLFAETWQAFFPDQRREAFARFRL
jgi:hypothetical protein